MALFDELRSFLAEVEGQQEKAAASKKKAEANTEAGSYEGGTSHPVKSVDDQTADAHEGTRSSENTADVKAQVPGGGVDSATDSTPDQEDQQFDVGLKSTSTGEDPAHEDDYKGEKEDPGTSHPAKTEDGEKYSSMNFSKLKSLTEKKANALIADISVALTKQSELVGDQHKIDANKNGKIDSADFPLLKKKKGVTEQKETKEEAAKTAAAVGYDQAVQAGQPAEANEAEIEEFFKTASENIIRGALQAADLTGAYVAEFNRQLVKSAEESEKHEAAESPAEETAEHAPGGEESHEAGGDLGLTDADMAAMAGGLGEEAGPEAGSAEVPGGDQAAVDELLSALAEMGVSPEEIMQAAAGGEGAGAMPPEMGAAPKMASDKSNNQIVTLMKAAKARQKSGKFRISDAKTAGQRQLREEIKKCIADIVG
jgi:hypothetical protein